MERTVWFPPVVWQHIAVHMGRRKALKLRLLSRAMHALMAECSQFWRRFYQQTDYTGPMRGYHSAVMRAARQDMLADARARARQERLKLVSIESKLATRRDMIVRYTKRI
jgi:hypothetical protein